MAEKSNGPDAMRGRRRGAVAAAAVLVLAAVPILLVPIPPSTDLPQHLAQVRLFKEALAQPGGPYVIQWLAPNNLIYFLLARPLAAPPVGLMARAALILVVIALAGGRPRARRPPGHAAAGRRRRRRLAPRLQPVVLLGLPQFPRRLPRLRPLVRPDGEGAAADDLEAVAGPGGDGAPPLRKPRPVVRGRGGLARRHRPSHAGRRLRITLSAPLARSSRAASSPSSGIPGWRRRGRMAGFDVARALVARLRPAGLLPALGLRRHPGRGRDPGVRLHPPLDGAFRLAEPAPAWGKSSTATSSWPASSSWRSSPSPPTST